jgi:CxxC motif-containing protein (DUF1111 family)
MPATVTLVSEDAGDRPFAKLPSEWLARFNNGDALFEQTFLDTQGIGPVFIRAKCASCHENDARGTGTVRKMVLLDDDGSPLQDQSGLPYGNTIRPQKLKGVAAAIDAPDDDVHVLVTVRVPPAVFARGYLEAILDSEIERVEAEQAERHDAVTGRINWVTYTSEPNSDVRFHSHAPGERLIGRFGLKARIATLDDFTADALQGDMGLTSEMRPHEVPNPAGDEDGRPGIDVKPEKVNLLADYMRMLRIPTRKPDAAGAELFEQAQCSACHVPSMHTAPDYALPLLADIDAPVYTDLLLHDLGADFTDGLRDHDAETSEWRTAPLIGLRFLTSYLHDGRASTIEQAIELHGASDSEAAESVERFRALDDASRTHLLAFLAGL